MASKDKLLASAAKNLEKGQLPKAIKDYQQVVELDPKDIRHRQKLADLMSRARMNAEAIGHYEMVAKHFSETGFYLKAIAVYKQAQKLDPEKADTYFRLAELNEKQGLSGNALAEYRTLVSRFEKRKMLSDAVVVLEKMLVLEPGNVNYRLKIAECYLKDGFQEQGKKSFMEVLSELREQQDYDRLLKLYEVFFPLLPEDREIQLGLAQALLFKGDSDKGVQLLKGLVKQTPDDAEILEVMAQGYRSIGDFAHERLTLQHVLKHHPDDLNIKIRVIAACLDGADFERALEDLQEWQPAFVEAQRQDQLQEFYGRLAETLPGDTRVLGALRQFGGVAVGAKSTQQAAPLPLSEVAAIATPVPSPVTPVTAATTQGELPSAAVLGESEPEVLSPVAAKAVGEPEESQGAGEIPLGFLEGMDDFSGEPEPTEASQESMPEESLTADFELDLELDLGPESEPAAPEDAVAVELELEIGELTLDEPSFEAKEGDVFASMEDLDFSVEPGLADEAPALAGEPWGDAAAEAPAEFELELPLTDATGAIETEIPVALEGADEAYSGVEDVGGIGADDEIEDYPAVEEVAEIEELEELAEIEELEEVAEIEELEELDEIEELEELDEIEALVEVAELDEVKKFEELDETVQETVALDPSAPLTPGLEEIVEPTALELAEPLAPELLGDLLLDEESTSDQPEWVSLASTEMLEDTPVLAADEQRESSQVVEPEEAPLSPGLRDELEETEFFLHQGLFDEAEAVCQRILLLDPLNFAAQAKREEVEQRRLDAAASSESEGDFFDLASEILDDGALKATEDLPGLDELDRFRFDGVFSEFKKGIDSQIDQEDTESHYNLGIAYKEMGLIDDAIAEFQKAMKDPGRRVDCLTITGICCAEKGDFEQAETVFLTGIANPELEDLERISLHYEMGLLYEVWGRPEDALQSFETVAASDLFFRGAGDKIRLLQGQLGVMTGNEEDAGAGEKAGKNRVSFI